MALSLALIALAAPPLFAQERTDSAADTTRSAHDSAAPPPVDEDVTAPRSPRASVAAFLALTAAGRYDSAATYLAVAPGGSTDGAALARQLRAVLDRHFRLDLDRISGQVAGDTADGLPPGVDRIGVIVGANGDSASVRLVRRAAAPVASAAAPTPEWRFGASTVERIPAWYDALEGRWALEVLPAPLLEAGPAGILWWQWIGLGVLLILAYLLGTLAARLVRGVAGRLVSRTQVTWDDATKSPGTTPSSSA